MRRKLNVKFLLVLGAIFLVATGGMALAHHLQYKRLPDALLRQSERAEGDKDWQRANDYLTRYLSFAPRDNEAKSRLVKLILQPGYPNPRQQASRAFQLLQDVLADDSQRHDLRRLFVTLAVDMQRLDDAETQLKLLPADDETSALWGRYYEAKLQVAEAVESYREAMSRNAGNVEATARFARLIRSRTWDNLGEQERSRKRQADAADADRAMNELVQANPDSWQARIARWSYRRDYTLRQERGEKWSEMQKLVFDGLTREAAQDVVKALELAGNELDVRLAAAEAGQRKGDLDEARAQLDQALKIKRKDARLFKAYSALELLVEDTKTSKEEKKQARKAAVNWLRQGARELPMPAQFELQWAHVCLLLSGTDPADLDEAAKVISKIPSTNITPAGTDYLQARLLMGRQQWAEAAKLFERCVVHLQGLHEEANQIDLGLGKCYSELNDPKKQYDAFARMAKRNPDSLVAKLGLANAARAGNNLDEAIRLLGALARAPEVPSFLWADQVRLHILKARLTRQADDWKRVEDTIADAERHKVIDAVEANVFRAECLLANKKDDEARTLLEETRKQHDKRVEPWAALALLAQKRNDFPEALRLLDEAAKVLTKPADQVELLLARANHWAGQKGDTAKAELAKLCEGMGKFEPTERTRLLSGLAATCYGSGHFQLAARLWKQLSRQEEYKADLRLRLMLFDLARQENDDNEMQAVLKEVQNLEGADGTFTRHARAMRLIWTVLQSKASDRNETLGEAVRLLDQVRLARPQWTPAWVARGEIEMIRRQPEQAATFFKEAFRLGDRSPSFLRVYIEALQKKQDEAGKAELARVMKGLSQEELARADLERAAVGVALMSQGADQNIDKVFKTVRGDSRDYRDHLWLGQTLARTGRKLPEAEQALRKAVELNDKEAETWEALVKFLVDQKRKKEVPELLVRAEKSIKAERSLLALAHCHARMGDPKKAREFYDKALADRPKDGVVLSDYANFLMHQNEPAKAEELLVRLTSSDVVKTPDQADSAHGRLAVVLSARGDFASLKAALPHVGLRLTDKGEVVGDTSLVQELTPELKRTGALVLASCNLWRVRAAAIERLESLDQAQALKTADRFLLATLYERKNDWTKARSQLNKLVMAPDCRVEQVAHYVRGLLERKELPTATRLLTRLEESLKDKKSPAHETMLAELKARWHEASNEGDKAVELLRERAGRKDADPQEVLLLAASLGRQKRVDEALKLIDQVWKACPPEMAGSTSVGLLRSGKTTEEQRKKVAELLSAAVKEQPKNANLHVQHGDVLDLLGNYQEAEKEYREALALEKDHVVALNNLAWLLALRSSKGDEALELIGKAIDKAGPVAELLDTRGVIFLAQDKAREALSDLQEALKEAPTAMRCFHLAQVQLKLDQPGQARAALRQAKELGLDAAALHPVEQGQFEKLDKELSER